MHYGDVGVKAPWLPTFLGLQIFLLDPPDRIICMGANDDLTGKLARLPDGQLVRVEEVHSDGYVTARRVEGERKGTVVVCAVRSLQPI